MTRLKNKLAIFNLLSKLIFISLFLILLPYVIERINLRQVDRDLIKKREKVIDLISTTGIEPFIAADSSGSFGSYNILKEEFVSIERTDTVQDLNFIEESNRLVEDEEITYRVLNYTLAIDGQKYLLEIGKSLSSIITSRKNIYSVIVIFLILIVLITFVTDLRYTMAVLKPLGRITNKIRGISDPASFDMTPVPTTTSDFRQLDEAMIVLMKNISELFQKEKEITDNISHELLTPVSVLRSRLENLLISDSVDNETAGKIEESLRTLNRLQVLVNSLLMIARIESQQYLKNDTFNLNELLKEIADEIIPVAEDKEVSVNEEFEDDYKVINANRTLIFSMFFNILNNAVKNTAEGGKVIIKSSFVNRRFEVRISDTGKGMTKDQISLLFARFKSRIDLNDEGTGIGLAIAKTIADFHRITVSVTSEPGIGTAFSFIFP